MQTRRLFAVLFVLGVLLSACKFSQPEEVVVNPLMPTQTLESKYNVIPTATDSIPKVASKETDRESRQPTSVPMVPGPVEAGVPLVLPRTKHTATLLLSGKILLVGGSVEGDDFASDEELIDPLTGKSTWTAPLHTFRHDHTATLLKDGRVLVIGGYNFPQQWLQDAEIYNPRSDNWTVRPPIFTHGTFHTATVLKDGKVLVVGGCIGSWVCTNKVEIFDPQTDTWREAAALQEDRSGHTAQLLEDGRVLIIGGITAYGNPPADGTALIYDPSTNTWQTMAPMEIPRYLTESVKLPNGDVLVAGGVLVKSSEVISNAVEIYDPDKNTWRTAASLANARYTFTLKLLPNGQVIAISGSRAWDCCWSENTMVHEIELYDPSTNRWQTIGTLPKPSAYATSTQLRDGRIWIAGGQVGNWVLDNTWLIQP